MGGKNNLGKMIFVYVADTKFFTQTFFHGSWSTF